MTTFVAFHDASLDSSIAAILRLQDGTAGDLAGRGGAAPLTLRHISLSPRASVTAVTALGIAAIGTVGLLAGRGSLGAQTPKPARRIIELASPAPHPSPAARTVSDAVPGATGFAALHRRHGGTWQRQQHAYRPAVRRKASSTLSHNALLLPDPAPEDLIDLVETALPITAPVAPTTSPAEPRSPVASPGAASSETNHMRRDSVDAIRSLRLGY